MRTNLSRLGLLLILLLLPASLAAVPPSLSVPKEVKGETSEFLRVDAVTDGKQVRWFALDRGLSVFPSDLLKDSKLTVVIAARPGSYRLAAITCLADELSDLVVTTVTIGGGPDPTPPDPTPPDPTPPPADPLAVKVRLLYDADVSAKKVEHAALLAAFYREAAKACDSPDVATAKALKDVLLRAAAGLIPDDALTGVRRLVASELARVLPVDPNASLSPASRKAAAELFLRLSAILSGVTKR